MSSAVPPPSFPGTSHPVRNGLWQRLSEGRRLDELWTQFTADAQASYGFYGKDLDWEQLKTIPAWRRPFRIAKHFFWALVMK